MTEDTNQLGRPTVMTLDTLQKLEDAFSIGATDREACLIANISSQSLYNFQKENPDYIERKEKLKDMPKYKARMNIVEAINAKNLSVSQWYAERKAKDEFSQRTEQTGKDGEALIPESSEIIKDIANKINDIYRRAGEPSNGGDTNTMGDEAQDKE